MKSSEVDQLIAHIGRLPDTDIIKALASLDDYTLEARTIYESEAKRRAIRPEAVQPVARLETQRRKNRQAATWSLKGIGERLYGMRSFRADGSYQTTKWFVFLYLPIYPIASLRIRHDDRGEVIVMDVLPPDWRQSVDTYCFVILSWAGIALGFRLLEQSSLPFREFLGVTLFGLPPLFLRIVRRRAARAIVQPNPKSNE